MFLSDLVVKKVGGEQWELVQPLVYASAYLDRVITVPAGFIHDFASVPRLPVIYSLFGNEGHRAAVVHDWLYQTKQHPDAEAVGTSVTLTRKQADDVFKEALHCCVPSWKAAAMYAAVRAAGGLYWK